MSSYACHSWVSKHGRRVGGVFENTAQTASTAAAYWAVSGWTRREGSGEAFMVPFTHAQTRRSTK
jgi:hypothetical protein